MRENPVTIHVVAISANEGSPLLCGEHKRNVSALGMEGVGSYDSPVYSSDDEFQVRELRPDESIITMDMDCETQEPIKDPPITKKKKRTSLWKKIDVSAFQFAIRMGVLLLMSSLFVLVRTDKYRFPDGMWVLITVLFVSWFPSLDAASVIEKIVQRLLGTFVGAFMGLVFGFASLVFADHHSTQAAFLGGCVFFFNFLIIFLAGQFKVGREKVIKHFSYATILCVLTFDICILPFADKEEPKWYHAMYRILNVIIGSAIGALGSIVIAPKSTTDVLYSKAYRQVTMAGEAAEAVLNVSADFFAGRIEVSRLADELLNAPLESELAWKFASSSSSVSSRSTNVHNGATDIALQKYEDAIADWRLSKMLFPLVKYDPFKIKLNPEAGIDDAFHTEIARTLARCLRIQTTIVVIDGMVRSDADYDFTARQLDSFAQTGRLIRKMLTLPLDRNASNEAAETLFHKLEQTRKDIHRISTSVGDTDDNLEHERYDGIKDFQRKLLSQNGLMETIHSAAGDEMGRGIPMNATGREDNTLFFLQLVEHLILRSLRLYQAWTHVETIRRRGP